METAHQRERRERAERRVAKLRRQAEADFEAARAETDGIPMGQPILVGHHSEKRHRKALERQDRKLQAAVETSRAADRAASRARGAGRSISSDDPEAIDALEARLKSLEEKRELWKRVNKLWRKGGAEALREGGIREDLVATAERTMGQCPWLKVPLDTKNLSANIRRIRKRIEELEERAEMEAAPDIEGDGFTIEEDVDENRIRFYFDERPDRETCRAMKSAGFRFSRRHMAWQRHLNAQGRAAALRMARELFGWEPEPSRPEPREQPSLLHRTVVSFNRHLMERRLRGMPVTAKDQQCAMRRARAEVGA